MYLFFDTETTGLPKSWKAPVSDLDNWPRMVQIAWLEYDSSGKQMASVNYIIKPDGYTIPADAAKIHGISTERALAEGVPLTQALCDFSDAMNRAECLVAHNMNFDDKIAGAEFLRTNIANKLFDIKKICTMTSSVDFCKIDGRYGYKWPKLSELHIKLFDVDFEEAHDAAVDVTACANCFFKLKELGVI